MDGNQSEKLVLPIPKGSVLKQMEEETKERAGKSPYVVLMMISVAICQLC